MRILWIHGLGEAGECFEAIADHPAVRRFHHLIPDLPGYGRTPAASPPMTLVAAADSLARSLEEPVVVVGHSMGGIIGMYLSERHPHLVRHLVNVEGNVSVGDCVYSGRALNYSREEFPSEGMAYLIAFVDELAATDAAHRGYAEHMRQADPATFHAHAGELVDISATEEVAARLAKLSVPVTFIAGVPDGICARSKELLRKASVPLVEIEPAGHWPFIDQPDAFADALRNVL